MSASHRFPVRLAVGLAITVLVDTVVQLAWKIGVVALPELSLSFVTLDAVLQRVHSEDRARVQAAIDRAASHKEAFDIEHRLQMPDGSVKHLHVVAHAVVDYPQNLQFAGAVMDLSPGLQNRSMAVVLTLAAIWSVVAINLRGVKEAGIFAEITTYSKLVPFGAIALVGLLYVDTSNFTPFDSSQTSLFSAGAALAPLTMFAFLGLESATVPAGDVRDPARTIPRATVLGISISTMGSDDQPDSRAVECARSMYASDGAMMIPELWCAAASRPGSELKLGSSSSATLIRRVADSLW